MINRLLVSMAMEAEAAPLLKRLGAQPLPPSGVLPSRHYRAKLFGLEIRVVVNGPHPHFGVDSIGTTSAALAVHDALSSWRPDLVLSVGTAGGWVRQDTSIGDVFLAWDRFVFHDRRISLPGFEDYGVANLAAADLRDLARQHDFKLGTVTTGDSLDESPTDRERIMQSGAAVKEMEGAAVAWAAQLHGVPVSAVKAITDLVDDPTATQDQFMANLSTASARLEQALFELLPDLASYEL